MRPNAEVYVVEVHGRTDGLYVFDDADVAARFASAVQDASALGPDATATTTEPVITEEGAVELIAAELGDVEPNANDEYPNPIRGGGR